MLYNRYKLKRYSNFLIFVYTILAEMVASDVSFKR